MTNKEFGKKLALSIGENFFYCDMVDQDELFDMQHRIATCIVEAANDHSLIAMEMVKALPRVFQFEEE